MHNTTNTHRHPACSTHDGEEGGKKVGQTGEKSVLSKMRVGGNGIEKSKNRSAFLLSFPEHFNPSAYWNFTKGASFDGVLFQKRLFINTILKKGGKNVVHLISLNHICPTWMYVAVLGEKAIFIFNSLRDWIYKNNTCTFRTCWCRRRSFDGASNAFRVWKDRVCWNDRTHSVTWYHTL